QRKNIARSVSLGLIAGLGLISYNCGSPAQGEPEQAEQIRKTDEKQQGNTGNTFVLKKEDLTLVSLQGADKSIEWPISGRVVPTNKTQLFSEVQGKVLNNGFKLKEGVSFLQGETLLTLDSKEFELQLEAQRSAFLNILTGMMPDLKADYPDNYQNWLTYVEQYESGQSLGLLPETKSAGEKYFVTSNQVYNTYYTIKAQEERLEKFRIIAPYSGLVTQAQADKGSLVSPGQMLGTIINNRSFELEAAASLEVASKLRIGDKITFRNNEIEGEWIGTVLRINDIVDAKTQNIPVYFQIAGDNIKAGMYLEGSFTGASYANVFAIPTSVLTRDDKVLLLENNTITGKEVELVDFIQDSILVRGLSNKDILITNQFDVPVEGLKLTM
ncbi:MAG: HlyD family efflux transporter periplasmic adaptor subunit, partial [Bacteroidota bacterium]